MTSNQKQPNALFYSSDVRSFYFARFKQQYNRATGKSILMLSMEREMEVLNLENGESHKTNSLLVPVGTNVSVNTNCQKVGICFLNDIGTDLRTLVPNMSKSFTTQEGARIFSHINEESQLIKSAEGIWDSRASIDDALEEMQTWVDFYGNHHEALIDQRVSKTVSSIRNNYSDNISVAQLASNVNLSVPRLSQLFKEETGVPIRSFRLWQRLYKAINFLKDGTSLTEAAIKSGFSDYAQCFRVYRDLGGINPSKTRANTEILVAA